MLENILNNLSSLYANGNISILLLAVSFLGGLLSSISPCSLAILPLVVGYVGGYGDKDKLKTFVQLLFFVIGLSFIMSLIGVICAVSGNVFSNFGGMYFNLILTSIILILGLNLLGLLDINFVPMIKKFPKGNSKSLVVYPFLIGSLFAFASSPCSTPILASIMGFATLTKNIFFSILMLFLFSIGQGIIIILAGIFTSFVKNMRNFASFSEIMLKISGFLLVLVSIFAYIKIFSRFF